MDDGGASGPEGVRQIDTIVIGAGHAGLCMSYILQEDGREHRVLEKGRTLEQWRSARWDSFRINSPLAYSRLPGQADGLPDARRSIPLGEMIRMWEACLAERRFPIREYCEVVSVEQAPDDRFAVHVRGGEGPLLYHALNVVAAPGRCQTAAIPRCAARLPDSIEQLRIGTYTSPSAVREGAVLVVGGGQTGVQLSEELAAAGRRVYLATSKVHGTPRDYRGEDIMFWLDRAGLLTTPRREADPDERRQPMPIVGHDHAISHHSLARMGVILLGTLSGISDDGSAAMFDDDLPANVDFARQGYEELVGEIEEWIARAAPAVRAGFPPASEESAWQPYPLLLESPAPMRLDLRAHDINTIVWATGWSADLGWLRIEQVSQALDSRGLPQACETPVDGFFWLGFDWLRFRTSGTVAGVRLDAAHVAGKLRRERP